MFIVALILLLSTGLFFFYLRAQCEEILRRQFDREYWQEVVKANGLEFPSVRKALEGFGVPVEYPQLMVALKSDFLALNYLLKNTDEGNRHYIHEERLLILYSRFLFAELTVRHRLGLRETLTVLKLAAILHFFANRR
jgi:hypothetical protein